MPRRLPVSPTTILSIGLLAAGLFGVPGVGLAPARGQESPAQEPPAVVDPQAIAVQVTIERRLLVSDLAAYREARTREVGARLHADELAARLDDQLGGETAQPVRAAREAAEAREELSQAEGRMSHALAALTERLRRIALLERLAPRSFGVPEGVKAEEGLAGRWQVALDSLGPLGTLELQLSDPVVFGSLTTPEGDKVAIRGSHDGNELRLEPVVMVGAPTRTFVGTLDPASGQLQGSWQGSDPATGQPAGAGTWTATRLRDNETETIQQEDIE
ncbi:MAG TPA: hypothetical protein VGS22_14385 [Thermoanaerobaculia bacterium]|jgi:hypothetical protein|nr:hypothetical protein [Thermoanaerobaculia bacterium]